MLLQIEDRRKEEQLPIGDPAHYYVTVRLEGWFYDILRWTFLTVFFVILALHMLNDFLGGMREAWGWLWELLHRS